MSFITQCSINLSSLIISLVQVVTIIDADSVICQSLLKLSDRCIAGSSVVVSIYIDDLFGFFLSGFFAFCGFFLDSFFAFCSFFLDSLFALCGFFLDSLFALCGIFLGGFFTFCGFFLDGLFALYGFFLDSLFTLCSFFLSGRKLFITDQDGKLAICIRQTPQLYLASTS